MLQTQKKTFSQYRHCVQRFYKTVLILTKNLLNMKFIYFLTNVNIFNKPFWKIPLFFIQITQIYTIIKIQISKSKN